MASPGQPDPTQGGGAPDSGASSGPPANPQQVMLAQMYQLCKRLAQANPAMSAGLEKAAQGIKEAQTAAMGGQSQPQPTGSSPSY